MTIQKRSMVMAALLAFALVLYGVAIYYSPSLALYVVEQSLTQKAPCGTNLVLLRERLHALVSATADRKAQMERLVRISEYLERAQVLTPEELDQLMAAEKTGGSSEIR